MKKTSLRENSPKDLSLPANSESEIVNSSHISIPSNSIYHFQTTYSNNPYKLQADSDSGTLHSHSSVENDNRYNPVIDYVLFENEINS